MKLKSVALALLCAACGGQVDVDAPGPASVSGASPGALGDSSTEAAPSPDPVTPPGPTTPPELHDADVPDVSVEPVTDAEAGTGGHSGKLKLPKKKQLDAAAD